MKPLKPFLFPGPPLKRQRLLEFYKLLRMTHGHQNWWPGDTPFEIMVGAILTQNTAWTNVEKAIVNLKKADCLTPQAMKKISEKELAELIRPAGYFNIKARRLKNFIHFLFEEYGGDLQKMKKDNGEILRQKLLAVNGIGGETADSILLYALEKPFFVIDAYTRRIFSRHRLTPSEDSYEHWQNLFMTTLPPQIRLFNDFHAQIVHLAKHYCKSSKPLCADCPINIFK